MLDKLRTLATAVNTWLVVAGAALAVIVNELAPLAELHPAVEWAVRVAGAGLVVLETARRVLARSTTVPAVLRGVDPDVDVSTTWPAWNGGHFAYSPPRRPGRRHPSVGVVPVAQDQPPDDAAA